MNCPHCNRPVLGTLHHIAECRHRVARGAACDLVFELAHCTHPPESCSQFGSAGDEACVVVCERCGAIELSDRPWKRPELVERAIAVDTEIALAGGNEPEPYPDSGAKNVIPMKPRS